MADETATNPVDGEDTAAATLSTDTGVEAEDPNSLDQEFDEDGNPIAADEDEEVELDTDLKLKVPKTTAAKLKELKEGNLRQADYTRKTQEVAEIRKAVEAERQTLHQASEAEVSARAQVVAIDQRLAEYQRIDWDAWEQQDPFEAQKGFRQFQQLQSARGQAVGQYSRLVQERTSQAQRATAKRVEEARTVLTREIGWNDQKAAEVLTGGIREYGFDRSEIEEFSDPRMVKALHDALQWRAHQAKSKKAASVAKGQEVTPATTLRGASGRTPVQGSTRDFAAFEKLASKTT